MISGTAPPSVRPNSGFERAAAVCAGITAIGAAVLTGFVVNPALYVWIGVCLIGLTTRAT